MNWYKTGGVRMKKGCDSMQVSGNTSVTQVIQDSIQALKDRARIARLKVMKSKMTMDHRLMAQLMDNMPPVEQKRIYGAITENLIDVSV
jgi:hypothetical protein